jgi:hypothetical protein
MRQRTGSASSSLGPSIAEYRITALVFMPYAGATRHFQHHDCDHRAGMSGLNAPNALSTRIDP